MISRTLWIWGKTLTLLVGMAFFQAAAAFPEGQNQQKNITNSAKRVEQDIGYLKQRFPGAGNEDSDNPVHIFFPIIPGSGDINVTPGKLPFVVFAHGYQLGYENYHFIWRHLVPLGYILVFPDRWSSDLFIQIDEYAAEIARTVQNMQLLNDNSSSPFYQRLNGHYILMGHSTGAGASFLSVLNLPDTMENPSAIIGLAPLGKVFATISGTDPFLVAGRIGVPSLIISGDRDCICPPVNHGLRLYQHLERSVPKVHVSLHEGVHCGFIDQTGADHLFCTLLESGACLTHFQKPVTSHELQIDLVVTLVSAWLSHVLMPTPGSWPHFLSALENPALTYQVSD